MTTRTRASSGRPMYADLVNVRSDNHCILSYKVISIKLMEVIQKTLNLWPRFDCKEYFNELSWLCAGFVLAFQCFDVCFTFHG